MWRAPAPAHALSNRFPSSYRLAYPLFFFSFPFLLPPAPPLIGPDQPPTQKEGRNPPPALPAQTCRRFSTLCQDDHFAGVSLKIRWEIDCGSKGSFIQRSIRCLTKMLERLWPSVIFVPVKNTLHLYWAENLLVHLVVHQLNSEQKQQVFLLHKPKLTKPSLLCMCVCGCWWP